MTPAKMTHILTQATSAPADFLKSAKGTLKTLGDGAEKDALAAAIARHDTPAPAAKSKAKAED